MNKFFAAIAVAAAVVIGFATPSQAGLFSAFQPKPKVVATVSISEQKMYLAVTDQSRPDPELRLGRLDRRQRLRDPDRQVHPDLALQEPQVEAV